MKISGTATLRAPVERVYAVLNDPAVLVRTIPGCERLEPSGPDAYRMTVAAGVAAIKGVFSGDVRLAEHRAPHSFLLRASGAGAPGTVSADVRVRLVDSGDGTTLLSYDADAVVGGMVGGVGQRVLSGVARKTAGRFFAAVDDVLVGVAPAAPASAVAALAGGPTSGALLTGAGPAAAAGPTAVAPEDQVWGIPAGDFAAGVVFGTAASLLGVVVGGVVAGRAARRR